MSTNGILDFQGTNKATFVGENSNVVIDTVNASFGIGVDVNGPTSNLHVVGNAYVTSNLEVGTANLFVDTSTSNVGIGTNAPGYTLDVVGDAAISSNLAVGTANLFVDTVNSRVGIGTANPQYRLDVGYGAGATAADDVMLRVMSASGTSGKLIFGRSGTTDIRSHAIETYNSSGANNNYMKFLVHDGTGTAPYETRTEVMTLRGDGNVGIGTTNPVGVNGERCLEGSSSTGFEYIATRDDTTGVADDFVGAYLFKNADTDGNSPHYAGMSAKMTGTNGPMDLRFHTNRDQYETDAVPAMIIDQQGNVGIGTDDPDSGFKLHVDGIIKAQAVNCSGGGPVITCTASNPGDMISKRYASADRYGMGQYAGGITRLFTSTAYSSGRICFSGATDDVTGSAAAFTDYVTIDNDGNVGIGTDPIGKLDIYQGDNVVLGGTTQTLSDPAPGLTLTSSSAKWAFVINSNDDLVLTSHGSLSGTYTGVTGYVLEGAYDQRMNDFTGQHRCFLPGVKASEIVNKTGLIVSANKNQYTMISHKTVTGQEAIDISESIPNVSISLRAYDKTCFGVISDVEDPEKREDVYGVWGCPFPKENGDDRVYINSVGEGAIWVTNINGPLESGDYITTSNVAGYGQKQDSEFLANYTVAKITMDCDFNPATRSVQIIRKEMDDVNYWVKTTYKNVSEEEYSNLADENRRIVDDIYQRVIKEDTKTEKEGYELEVRQELVNVLDEHGQIQWEDTDETEKAYKIRYLDADGNITDEANAVHTAAFVGCTYHCG